MIADFKVEQYEHEHPGTAFPRVRALASEELQGLRTRLRAVLDLPADADALSLTKAMVGECVPIPGLNATDAGFELGRELRKRGVTPEAQVWINWYRLDDVDEMSLQELAENLSYIWYPSVDDIEVFDRSLSWILSIAHTGDIGFGALQAPKVT